MNSRGELIVIGCGKAKVAVPKAKAVDLYNGPLYKAHLRLARSQGGPHYILSGKYGLVRPERVVANYDTTMTSGGRAKKDAWGAQVLEQFRAVGRPKKLVVLCGKQYLHGWHEQLQEDGWEIVTPLMGLKVGERLAKVNEILGGNR